MPARRVERRYQDMPGQYLAGRERTTGIEPATERFRDASDCQQPTVRLEPSGHGQLLEGQWVLTAETLGFRPGSDSQSSGLGRIEVRLDDQGVGDVLGANTLDEVQEFGFVRHGDQDEPVGLFMPVPNEEWVFCGEVERRVRRLGGG